MSAIGVGERRPLRSVAVPSEHGGWGLTLEPVVLGLLIAPSLAGAALAAGAFLAFLVRTPLKFVAVDRRRQRWLPRSVLALRVALVELAALAVLAGWVTYAEGPAWLVPVALAAPLAAVALWFDARSRSRRLLPELCGTGAMASVVAAIVIAGGRSGAVAAGAWLVLAGRSAGAIPFVRAQIARLHGRPASPAPSDVMQVVGVGAGVAAALVEHRLLAGLLTLIASALLHVLWARRPPVPAKVLGLRQAVLGLGLVVVTALGVILTA